MVVVSQPVVDHLQIESRQWLVVGFLSLLLHSGLVLLFSAQTPDFTKADSSDFKVGLVASEGIGQSIQMQTSLPDIVAVSDVVADQTGIVTQHDTANDIVPVPTLEATEQLSPVEFPLTESIDLAAVVTPKTSNIPDVSPPALNPDEIVIENRIEESRPVVAVAVVAPSADSVDADVVDTIGVSADIENVDLVDDFFRPSDVLTKDDSMKTMPIEQLAAVPAPVAIKPDNKPELANDVEILEIVAQEVLARRPVSRPVQRENKKTTRQTGTGNDPLHPGQNPLASLGSNDVSEKIKKISDQKPEKPAPIIVPRAYALELKALLKLHKQYPVQAHRLRQEGVVIMGLVIDRSGEIISHEIKRSSGHKSLDQEVERMIQRAEKMPALPADFPNDTLELLIPIRFKVKS